MRQWGIFTVCYIIREVISKSNKQYQDNWYIIYFMQLFALVLSYYWVGVYSQCLINIFLTLLLLCMRLSRQEVWFILVSTRCLVTSPELCLAMRSCRGLTTCQEPKVFHKPRCLHHPRIGTCRPHSDESWQFQYKHIWNTEATAVLLTCCSCFGWNKKQHIPYSPYKGVTEVQVT